MAIAIVAYTRLKKISTSALGTALSAPFFLAVAVGRLGCFANGCCFGLPTSSFLGVHFPPWSQASRVGRRLLEDSAIVSFPGNAGADVFVPAVHPTQLYSAGGAVLCMGIVLWLRRRAVEDGVIASVSIGLLGLLRLVVDHFRYFEPSTVHAGLPTNSWIGIVFVAVSVLLTAKTLRYGRGRYRDSTDRLPKRPDTG